MDTLVGLPSLKVLKIFLIYEKWQFADSDPESMLAMLHPERAELESKIRSRRQDLEIRFQWLFERRGLGVADWEEGLKTE